MRYVRILHTSWAFYLHLFSYHDMCNLTHLNHVQNEQAELIYLNHLCPFEAQAVHTMIHLSLELYSSKL
jgi:hypothetical protein